MPLKSPRFANNARLQAAADNAPPMKWGEKGQAVKIVQQAYIDLGFAMPISTRKTGQPDGIFGNETYYVTRAFQKKHTLGIDGIVGKQTLGKLDELFPKPAPPPPPRPSVPPKFEASKKHNGFDPNATPPWQMVPVNGHKVVRLMNANDLDVTSANPAIATVEEINKCFVHGGREFIIRGKLKGTTFIEVREGAKLWSRLEVAVKNYKPLKVSFHFVQDNAGHKTTRSPSDVDSWVKGANNILFPQINVEVKKHNVRPNVKINKDLGSVVRYSKHLPGVPESEHEWDDVVAHRDNSADLNVFFVWEYEQDDKPNQDTSAEAGTSGGNCLFEDNIYKPTYDTLAHEIGHHLGVHAHSAKGGDLLMSPQRTDTRINKAHANKMNP